MSLEGKFGVGDFDGGVLCQGEIVLSKEQDRLLAKKAWLYLWEYLTRNDERVKVTRLPIPWSLQEDKDIERAVNESSEFLKKRFSDPKGLIEFQKIEARKYTQKMFEMTDMKLAKSSERIRWMVEQTLAENPLTVLDVGAGYGNVSVTIARHGICTTSVVCCEEETIFAKEHTKEENLPMEWLVGLFEQINFGERKFDVVLCGEVIEHVADPMNFLQKCCDLAKKAVVVTTPYGSVEGGFVPNADWREHNSFHVRAFSHRGFEQLLAQLTGVKVEGEIVRKYTLYNYLEERVHCICAKLVKTEVKEHVGKKVEAGIV